MKASEIMTPNPGVVTPQDTVTRAAQLMEELDVGSIPVVDDRTTMRLVGIVTDRDLAIRHVGKGHHADCPVEAHMTTDHLDVVHPDADVHDVMGRMGHDRVRRIPVVENGHLVSQADIAVRLGPTEPNRVERVLEHISEPARPRR